MSEENDIIKHAKNILMCRTFHQNYNMLVAAIAGDSLIDLDSCCYGNHNEHKEFFNGITEARKKMSSERERQNKKGLPES